MKNSLKKTLLCLSSSLFLLSSCSGGGPDGGSSLPSSEPASSDASSPASSEDREKVILNSLNDAVESTSSFSLDVCLTGLDGAESDYTFQAVSPDFYYYAPNSGGYAVLEEDPRFVHAFTAERCDETNVFAFSIDMHGRYCSIKDKSSLFSNSFLNILSTYADDFVKIDDYTFASTEASLATECKDFFQSRALGYCNYFEVSVDEYGDLVSFSAAEKSLDEMFVAEKVLFRPFAKDSFAPFAAWREKGSPISLRLFDIKTGYGDDLAYHLNYQGEQVTVSGIVSSFDEEGGYVIATQSDYAGSLGVRVVPAEGTPLPSLKDIVSVTGTVKGKNYVPYLDQASFEKTGESSYYPFFDEESIVNVYGAGYYGANVFVNTPIFGDSVYSTYAYVYSLPEAPAEKGDTTIDFICPSFRSQDGDSFHFFLSLPEAMEKERKAQILQSLSAFGTYTSDPGSYELVSLDKMLIRFSPRLGFALGLEYGSESRVGKALSPQEKVAELTGEENFPFPSSDSYYCYRFGKANQRTLEEVYGKPYSGTEGVYYYSEGLTQAQMEEEIENLSACGFALSDRIMDASREEHSIYKKGDVIADFTLSSGYLGTGYIFSLWVYKGDLVYKSTIQEELEASVSFFPIEDFIQPEGVYQADMALYELPVYAGKRFEEGSYLPCLTIDVNQDCFATLRSRYIKEKGYSTYRNQSGTPYTYRTRGASHYVLCKALEDGETLFLDMALYPTTDYTFAGHDAFQNRIEILFYKGDAPIYPDYQSDLSEFFSEFARKEGLTGDLPEVDLPEDAKVELWYGLDGMEQYSYLYYGYLSDVNAFVYTSSVEEAYASIVDGLKQAGFVLDSTTPKGNEVYVNRDTKFGSYILLFKDAARGLIRLKQGGAGLDF